MWQRSLNKGSEYLIPAYQLFDIGAFATTTYNTGKWVLSGGMRVDNRHLHSFELEGLFDRFSRDFTGVTGSVGAVYNATENMTFRMNVARGFRAPNLGELASNGVHEGTVTYEIGNHSLRPEYSWQADLGWDYTSKMLTTSLAIFTNFIDNYIFTQKLDGVKTDGYDTYKYIQGDARLIGGEASVDFHPSTVCTGRTRSHTSTACNCTSPPTRNTCPTRRHLGGRPTSDTISYATERPSTTPTRPYRWSATCDRTIIMRSTERRRRHRRTLSSTSSPVPTSAPTARNGKHIPVVQQHLRPDIPEPPQPTEVSRSQSRQRTHRNLQYGSQLHGEGDDTYRDIKQIDLCLR